MWSWFVDALRAHPEPAIFLTLALGFFVGRLRHRSFTLGSVTGTLLAGVLVGQLDIAVPDLVKTVAFIAFLFALGYQVGPQFFAGLRKGGVPALAVAGQRIGLSTSGGALIMGLPFGWLRARRPAFGRFPAPAQWLMNTGGPCLFVGTVGISSGPAFVHGVAQKGVGLVLGGLVVTLAPMMVCLYLGRWLFRFDTPVLLGVIAGANTTTASIGAITETVRSRAPVLGCTVPYALGDTLLTIRGNDHRRSPGLNRTRRETTP
ncbi:hypothetical protein ACFVH6_31155 [Spirillospora sp. NPDC127200]